METTKSLQLDIKILHKSNLHLDSILSEYITYLFNLPDYEGIDFDVKIDRIMFKEHKDEIEENNKKNIKHLFLSMMNEYADTLKECELEINKQEELSEIFDKYLNKLDSFI